MTGALARALTMVTVLYQSYWESSEYSLETSEDNSYNYAEGYHLAGIVLARGGSKGILRKNMMEINGQPLVGRALNAMVESNVFDSIWVSTDDQEISNWVQTQYPPKTVRTHKRAPYTATDDATSMSAVLEFLSFHPEIDAIGLVQATSPFIQAKYIAKGAKLLSHYESVFSVTRSHQLRWTAIAMDGPESSKVTKAINFDPKARPRRQDWKGEMVENGMFYFVWRHILLNQHVFQSEKSGYVEIPKHLSMEIDTPQDLEIARCLAVKFDMDPDPVTLRVKKTRTKSSNAQLEL